MLRCFRQIIQKYSYINLTIAIGKIHFKDPTEKNEVRLLIDQLSESERVSIKIASSHQECQSIMAQSDIGLSLWEPNDQNINQISTKFLEYLSNNCITICFRSPIYEDHLGSDYSLFITNINELENALEKSILSAFNTRGSCANDLFPKCADSLLYRIPCIEDFKVHRSFQSKNKEILGLQFFKRF